MDVLRAALAVLASRDPQAGAIDREALLENAERLLAIIPVLIAASWRLAHHQEVVNPDPALTHTASFFHLLIGAPPSELQARVFDAIQILYAEHGYNASTFTARVTVSTLSDLWSGVISAIGALKGPLHGGANEAAIEMLLRIGSPEAAPRWIREALNEKQVIMGFGHREYKSGDVRASIVKKYLPELAEAAGDRWLLPTAQVVEEEMYAIKGLYANLDFPVAVAYYLMGIPVPLYTPLFVMSRVAGWSAHVMEQLADNRIIRPRSLYQGPHDRSVPVLDARGRRKVANG
jgi:citrate synthase